MKVPITHEASSEQFILTMYVLLASAAPIGFVDPAPYVSVPAVNEINVFGNATPLLKSETQTRFVEGIVSTSDH